MARCLSLLKSFTHQLGAQTSSGVFWDDGHRDLWILFCDETITWSIRPELSEPGCPDPSIACMIPFSYFYDDAAFGRRPLIDIALKVVFEVLRKRLAGVTPRLGEFQHVLQERSI